MPKLELMKDGSIFASGDTTKRDVYELEFELDGLADEVKAIRIEALPDDRLPDRGPGKTYYEGRKGDFFLSELDASLDGLPIKFTTASHSFSEPGEKRPKFRADNVFDGDGSTGWFPGARKSRRLSLVMQLEKPIKSGGKLSLSMLFERHYTVSLGRFRVSIASEREVNADRRSELVDSLLRQDRALNEEEVARLERQFLLESPVVEPVRKELEKLVASPPTAEHSLVMKERASANLRPTFRHHRGEYLSPKEPVTGGIPQVLRDGDKEPQNRLELARWLVSEQNPLAARVAVNRAWREFFGEGLVKGSDDFGVQTPLPIHAELLDWLSVHYQGDLGWSTKELHRMIVMSATYQQSSSNGASRKLDPDNAYLSRGPSFRLPGEVVRDLALSATGALSTKMYGPGVRPPQPSSVTDLAWGNSRWTPSKGEDRFRRSIYTFRKRTASFAAYTVFDGPTGEVCTAMRNRSNTPLQALTLMNDDMFVELTKIHAKQVTEKFDSVSPSLEYIFRSFLTRKPTVTELSQLRTFFDAQKRRLASGELSVEEVGGSGATIDTAAYALVSRAVMNLHETITKP